MQRLAVAARRRHDGRHAEDERLQSARQQRAEEWCQRIDDSGECWALWGARVIALCAGGDRVQISFELREPQLPTVEGGEQVAV